MIQIAEKFFVGFSQKYFKCIRDAFLDWEDKQVIPKPLKALFTKGKYNNSEYLAKHLKELIDGNNIFIKYRDVINFLVDEPEGSDNELANQQLNILNNQDWDMKDESVITEYSKVEIENTDVKPSLDTIEEEKYCNQFIIIN